jgi:hypothetical protein
MCPPALAVKGKRVIVPAVAAADVKNARRVVVMLGGHFLIAN